MLCYIVSIFLFASSFALPTINQSAYMFCAAGLFAIAGAICGLGH